MIVLLWLDYLVTESIFVAQMHLLLSAQLLLLLSELLFQSL
jgi:hypothetical protein